MAYTYARRKALALRKFGADPSGQVDPYTYYRRVSEFVRDKELFTRETGVRTAREDFESAALFYEAFERGDPDDYSVHIENGEPVVKYGADGKPQGAKAALFIRIFGYVTDPAAWRELYPSATRYGHLLPEGTVIRKPKRAVKKSSKRKVRKRK